jgi:hypothetical protein
MLSVGAWPMRPMQITPSSTPQAPGVRHMRKCIATRSSRPDIGIPFQCVPGSCSLRERTSITRPRSIEAFEPSLP